MTSEHPFRCKRGEEESSRAKQRGPLPRSAPCDAEKCNAPLHGPQSLVGNHPKNNEAGSTSGKKRRAASLRRWRDIGFLPYRHPVNRVLSAEPNATPRRLTGSSHGPAERPFLPHGENTFLEAPPKRTESVPASGYQGSMCNYACT